MFGVLFVAILLFSEVAALFVVLLLLMLCCFRLIVLVWVCFGDNV